MGLGEVLLLRLLQVKLVPYPWHLLFLVRYHLILPTPYLTHIIHLLARRLRTLRNQIFFQFSVIDCNSFENLNHFDDLVIAVLPFLLLLSLLDQFISEQVHNYLFLEVGALP